MGRLSVDSIMSLMEAILLGFRFLQEHIPLPFTAILTASKCGQKHINTQNSDNFIYCAVLLPIKTPILPMCVL